ncbi:hypothetical protein [Mucilaginibacter sp.]|jgi:hypothetical protein|uniref:hypothetical protein n=1 Tax=Mucilaginibacter sp. TaxID=1882438 RepID=UPI0035675BFE
MKHRTIMLFSALTLVTSAVKAQTSKAPGNMQPPPANVVIDGNLNEWGDSLRYLNEEKKIPYTLANDQENLYVAIRINDRMEQARIINAGITLSIDPKGKKKETFAMTFPLSAPGSKPQFGFSKDDNGEVSQQDRDELARERLTTLRNIKVTGFKDIEYDMITTSNTYGIKAAINYDADGNLVYEAAIPLKFFHADSPSKSEWAFNFKINGMQKAVITGQGGDAQGGGMGGGRGGRGGGGGMSGGGGRGGRGGRSGGGMRGGGNTSNADRSELFKSVDFWEKFYLAK